MQTVPVNFEDGNKPTGTNYVNAVKRIVRQPIKEAIQTLYDQEGIKGERASKHRRKAIDAIITSLKRWEQIDAWLSPAISKNFPEIPASINKLALREDQDSKAASIGEKISIIGNLLDAFDSNKEISEATSHADLIWSFTEAVNETADKINELLHERNKSPVDVPNSIHWTP